MSTPFLIREFDREADYPLVSAWWEARGKSVLPLAMLPKLGVVVFREASKDPVAALWLYMDNSCGVCFMERAVTRPGLRVTEARDALLLGVEFLKRRAADPDLNYGVMFLRTYPAMAKYAKRIGFVSEGESLECLFALTKEDINA